MHRTWQTVNYACPISARVSREREECLRRQLKYTRITYVKNADTRILKYFFLRFERKLFVNALCKLGRKKKKKTHNFIRINVDNIPEDSSRIERTFLSRGHSEKEINPFIPNIFCRSRRFVSNERHYLNCQWKIACAQKKICIETEIMRPEGVISFYSQDRFRGSFSKRNAYICLFRCNFSALAIFYSYGKKFPIKKESESERERKHKYLYVLVSRRWPWLLKLIHINI